MTYSDKEKKKNSKRATFYLNFSWPLRNRMTILILILETGRYTHNTITICKDVEPNGSLIII